jgi:hypothetical protein
VVQWFWKVVPYPFPSQQEVEMEATGKMMEGYSGTATSTREENNGLERVGAGYNGHSVREAEQLNQSENASECS